MDEIDWGWLRSFVAVAEAGSLRAAAEGTAVSQPTLSRHVQHLEEALGVALFDRTGRGLTLSPRGAELYEAARDVQGSVNTFLRHARGLEEALSGSVRVTTSRAFGAFVLPRWLEGFRRRQPEISIDLVTDDSAVDRLTRDAEVAVRLFRPAQLDLLARRCGDTPTTFWASRDYLDAHGTPTDSDELLRHPLIGFDRNPVFLETAARMGSPLTRDHFVLRTDDIVGQVMAVRAGLGIAAFGRLVGQQVPELVEVMPGAIPHAQEVWLVAHPDVQRNPRVRAVWRDLAEFFEGLLTPTP